MIEETPRTASAAVSIDDFLPMAMSNYCQAGFSFALWKLPDQRAIRLAASGQPKAWATVSLEESESGFLFAPFDPSAMKIFLPADESLHYDDNQLLSLNGSYLEKAKLEHSSRSINKIAKYHVQGAPNGRSAEAIDYEELVRRCRDGVIDSRFEKIVPSRCKRISLPDHFELSTMFHRLCRRYPSAMVSVFSSPLTGTWIGATPEILVSVDKNQHFHTAAVAGTQSYVAGADLRKITWTQKDIEEQALVERYIINCFKKIRLREFNEHGPKTVIAGNVVHLKTEFQVDMLATQFPQLGSVMLKLLHPTSAVCGMPLDASLDFLKENEGYDRQFYSGYVGPLHINKESHLFVNLRCMQLFETEALLYAGAGVLTDSVPEREWEETELKMNTLLEVIRQ